MECLLSRNGLIKSDGQICCLNPYSNGMLTQSMETKIVIRSQFVLILILMECLLSSWTRTASSLWLCLNPYSNGMLTQQKTNRADKSQTVNGLNPYSNGMLTQFLEWIDKFYIKVLILILMECLLRNLFVQLFAAVLRS